MTFETFIAKYWWIFLILFVIIIMFFVNWMFNNKRRTKKAKINKVNVKNIKQIENIINDIRLELRAEHKRITMLFKDLDDFVAQLPTLVTEDENI